MPCSSDSVRRGSLGKVEVDGQAIARITLWELTRVVEETAWGDSDSAGFTNRVKGREDATGSVTGKFDNDDPVYDLFDVGDTVELVLWETTTAYWDFPCALIQSFNISYNQDTKEAVEWNASWGADGIFYRPGAAGAPAQVYPV